MNDAPIGIFDSGSGGLTVLSKCRSTLPGEDFIYLADREFAPYGNRSADYIIERSFACVNRLASWGCKAVVIACNTATNAGIEVLRESFDLPIIGVEPALKPAFEADEFKNIIILCTPATAKAAKFQNLYQKYGSSRITVFSQKDLASLIENNLHDLEKIRPQVYGILSAYPFADAIVLGCTHYNYIESMIDCFYALYGSPVKIFESSAGTANRLKSVITEKNLLSDRARGTARVIF